MLDTLPPSPYQPDAFRGITAWGGQNVAEQDNFDDRLRQARARKGLDIAPEKGEGKPVSGNGVGFRAGVEVVSALIVGIGLGTILDRWLGTWPWLFLVFFLMGGVAGVLNVFRLFNPRSGAK
ncbi:MAG: hypothetical protein JWO26_1768 [Rhodospirillales bacterium]|nr:hypothetical protein [Rhodospirillales bacterium]MDB5382136.1 hypothetical protein [Rhodospirillales bacterium]